MIIKVAQLGLAAYIKMHGVPLIKVEDKVFFFESDVTASQWRAQYSNSESIRHDSFVCELRNFLRP